MSYLGVPGASLYYETKGQGPLLLCISGADGSCEIWRAFADCLKDKFTVVMWDRKRDTRTVQEERSQLTYQPGRGFSRSYLNGAQGYEHRLETDADDAARIIQHLAPNELATVIGNSAGAIVALKLLVRHPDIIRTLIPYEPPLASILPDAEDLRKQHQEVYNVYRRSGMHPAFENFAEVTKADQAMVVRASDPRLGPYQFSNTQYWFEREFMFYPFAPFSVESELKPLKDKLMPVVGELSSREPYQYRANATMAEAFGLDLVHLPGEHVGHATHPKNFAEELLSALNRKNEYYAAIM